MRAPCQHQHMDDYVGLLSHPEEVRVQQLCDAVKNRLALFLSVIEPTSLDHDGDCRDEGIPYVVLETVPENVSWAQLHREKERNSRRSRVDIV